MLGFVLRSINIQTQQLQSPTQSVKPVQLLAQVRNQNNMSSSCEQIEEQQILSGGLPVATMSGTSSEVVPGTFYRHQSAFRTEKADSLGRDSRVEGVSSIFRLCINILSEKSIYVCSMRLFI